MKPNIYNDPLNPGKEPIKSRQLQTELSLLSIRYKVKTLSPTSTIEVYLPPTDRAALINRRNAKIFRPPRVIS